MIRINVSNSAKSAKSYYTKGLTREDYYSEGQEIIGNWGGRGAERLGLKDRVQQEQFIALCDNINPATQEKLTARIIENRRIGYDINFHCPKSVSLVYEFTQDETILQSFRESVAETMTEMEKDMMARVRKDHQNDNRLTGNLTYAEFIHFTARPVSGVPDPHLHAHCFTFNASYDPMEQQWKAGEFGLVNKNMPYYEGFFHATLADKLKNAGFAIDKTKSGWELKGIEKATLDKFSKRTELIEKIAQDKNITSDKAKDQLGSKTRENKNKGLDKAALREIWWSRLTGKELADLRNLKNHQHQNDITAEQAKDHAMAHLFERSSVVSEKRLQGVALKYGVGQVTPNQVREAFRDPQLLARDWNHEKLMTTREILDAETRMIRFARDGRGKCFPLNHYPYACKNPLLNDQQKNAVNHVLKSYDRVIFIEGRAGVGKTTLIKEAVEGIKEGGREVFLFAPTSDASRGVLRMEGFEKADTVASLIQNERLHPQLKDQVIWIDEAGLLGGKPMHEIFKIAEQQNCRVILTGDTRQNRAVELGGILKTLRKEAGLSVPEIKEIQRQKGLYKEAVYQISEGHFSRGFEKLDKMGAIKEIESETRYVQLAEDYLQSTEKKQTALVVTPTHAEAHLTTQAIREQIKAKGGLVHEKTFEQCKPLTWTEAQKQEIVNYEPGMVLQFHQNAKNSIKRGEKFIVKESVEGKVTLVSVKTGQELPLDTTQSAKFQVFKPAEIKLAVGDKIRFTQNGYDLERKHRLNNGDIRTIKDFTPDGHILLDNGRIIAKDHSHLTYGYCTTAHASQGKTVDNVIIAQSSLSWGASSAEQFYVSVSRGKKDLTIYTDSKIELKNAISKTDRTLSATELMHQIGARERRNHHARNQSQSIHKTHEPTRQR
jgi:conjugative relaxase-like TrwC/TraI family protein